MTFLNFITYMAFSLMMPIIICWKFTDPLITAWCKTYYMRNKEKWPKPLLFMAAVASFQVVCQIAFFFQMSRFGRALAQVVLG